MTDVADYARLLHTVTANVCQQADGPSAMPKTDDRIQWSMHQQVFDFRRRKQSLSTEAKVLRTRLHRRKTRALASPPRAWRQACAPGSRSASLHTISKVLHDKGLRQQLEVKLSPLQNTKQPLAFQQEMLQAHSLVFRTALSCPKRPIQRRRANKCASAAHRRSAKAATKMQDVCSYQVQQLSASKCYQELSQ